jgi:hypothetical protein
MPMWLGWALAAVVAGLVLWFWWKSAATSEYEVRRADSDENPRAATEARQRQLLGAIGVTLAIVAIAALATWALFLRPELDARQQTAREALYRTGYTDGWAWTCSWMFYDMLDTPGGTLFNGDVPYDAAWCRTLQPPLDSVPETLGDNAYDAGWSNHGDTAEAVAKVVTPLCFGSECRDPVMAYQDLLDSMPRDDMYGY